ncbi:mechanosensitive ion channel family protein [Deinococcus altitudinis]|uniref:mechanosensitive ion channel family protein n=1 Tax=Deinococcus altitudinis TaxID=468914 RepID=UPI0038919058
MDALTVQLTQPLSWLKLGFTLLIGYAVWRVVDALLRLVAPHIHRRVSAALRWLWGLGALYATVAAAVHTLGLSEVPLLYDHGEIIAQSFRASIGQVVVVGSMAFIAWNLVTLAARRVVPDTAGASMAEFTRRNVRVQTLTSVTEGSLRLIIVILTGISVLQALGVNATALLAGVSVLGLAVGFGAQSLIKDVFTGFFILFEDQYGVGDIIRVNGGTLSGTVERLTLRLTVLRALDGTVHLIPNGQVLTVSVSSKDWSQVLATFLVPNGADIDRALEVMEQVAGGLHADPEWQSRFLAPPEVQGVTNLSSDGTELRALLKVLPKSQFAVGREFNRRIRIAMSGADLGIPGPAPLEVRISQAPFDPAPAQRPAPDITKIDERQMDPEAKKADPPR